MSVFNSDDENSHFPERMSSPNYSVSMKDNKLIVKREPEDFSEKKKVKIGEKTPRRRTRNRSPTQVSIFLDFSPHGHGDDT